MILNVGINRLSFFLRTPLLENQHCYHFENKKKIKELMIN